MGDAISVIQIAGSETIALSDNFTYDVDLVRENANGYFSIQIYITGDGTLKAEYLVSNDGTHFIEPTGATDIFSAYTKTSGPGSDGRDIVSFEPELAGHLRIKFTETGGANSVTIDAFLAIQ